MKTPKTSHAAATRELRASGLEPVERYPGRTSLPFLVRCLDPKCEGSREPFRTYLSSVRALAKKGRVGCTRCLKRQRAHQRRAEMITLGRVLPMAEVIDSRTPTKAWCLRCWQVCDPGPRLDNIKNGKQGGCEHCGGKKRFTDEAARQMAREWGYIPDPTIAYQNDTAKWPGRCIAKSHYCEPVLNSRFNQGPCGTCAENGFKPYRPALLYLVVHPGLVAAKIGICEDSPRNTRLADHRRSGWNTIETMRFALGSHAHAVEKTIKQSWRDRGFPPVLNGGLAYVGYTETVSLTSLGVDDIWTEVCAAAEQVSADQETQTENASTPKNKKDGAHSEEAVDSKRICPV